MADQNRIAAILLAAGGSSRLGRPKQLVIFEGKTLIRRAAETLVASGCFPIIVVLGAETNGSALQLDGLPVDIFVNEDWRTGMSSSLRVGLRHVPQNAESVLISLCDQPFITVDDLIRLIDTFRDAETKMAASRYSGHLGVPAIFPRRFFPSLMALIGDRGARGMLAEHQSEVVAVTVENAAADIDTTADLTRVTPPL